jgi:tRNA pseudouridine55 synthase
MQDIIPYYKPLGFTPLQAIEKLKSEHPELSGVPITYAGRLDPMAEGLLLLAKGEAIIAKQSLIDLPKTYEAKILFGFASDTFDILGLAKSSEQTDAEKIAVLMNAELINSALQSFIGVHNFPYPPYSSKTVNGKQLWQWSRENKLDEIEIPNREMTLHSADLNKVNSVLWSRIYETIIDSIKLTSGDFRQAEIVSQWEQINKTLDANQEFQIAEITFNVSSGTYIRTLANELGKQLQIPSMLFALKRISIGEYDLTNI